MARHQRRVPFLRRNLEAQPRHAGDAIFGDPARHDPAEMRKVRIKVHRKAKKINGGFFQIKSHFSLSVQFLSVTFLKKKKYFDSISAKIFQKIEENIEEEIRFLATIFKTAAFRSVSRLTIS